MCVCVCVCVGGFHPSCPKEAKSGTGCFSFTPERFSCHKGPAETELIFNAPTGVKSDSKPAQTGEEGDSVTGAYVSRSTWFHRTF